MLLRRTESSNVVTVHVNGANHRRTISVSDGRGQLRTRRAECGQVPRIGHHIVGDDGTHADCCVVPAPPWQLPAPDGGHSS
jgi:hypothetical protein